MKHLFGLFVALSIYAASTSTGSGEVIINEVLASNVGGLRDSDGDDSDWIELYNNSDAPVNLEGWFLTDSATELQKWRFPNVVIGPKEFLVIFASDKDRTNGQLHTNFKLGHETYVGLIKSDGTTVASSLLVDLPAVAPNISMGVGTNFAVTTLVSTNARGRALTPTNIVSPNWMRPAFTDSAWRSAVNGIGYQSLLPGFAVRHIQTPRPIFSSLEAERVLSSARSVITNTTAPSINFLNSGTNLYFPADRPYPGLPPESSNVYGAMEITGVITIPALGNWTFCVSAEYSANFRVTIGGQTFSSDGIIIDAEPPLREPFPPILEWRDTFATFRLAAGTYPVRMVIGTSDRWGALEFSAAQGSFFQFNNRFRIIGDTARSGLLVRSKPPQAVAPAFIKTDLFPAMFGRGTVAYLRLPFNVADPATFTSLTLGVNFDDGFVAWLNGVEIARRNAPGALAWNSKATANRPDALAAQKEEFAIAPRLLRSGANLLAVQGLTWNANARAFLARAELAQRLPLGVITGYFVEPTPGKANSGAVPGFTGEVEFSVGRGFYFTEFPVALTTPTPGAFIKFTTNGSPPSLTNGFLYSEPILISGTTPLRAVALHPGLLPSPPTTHTYVFPAQVARQDGAGFPPQWGNVPANYDLNPAVTESPDYGPTFTNDLLSLPTMSISLPVDAMFGPKGIYSNSDQSGPDWERPCSVEFFHPDGAPGFDINCGIRIKGGASRSPDFVKHGFRLHFDAPYGPGDLDYQFYSDSKVNDFETVSLHGSYVDNFLTFRTNAQFIRDLWVRDSLNSVGQPAPHGRYTHLYINGLYWGLYDIGERPTALWTSQYYDGNPSEWDVINADEVVSGNDAAWNDLLTMIQNQAPSESEIAQVRALVDYTSFADYMLANFYAANTDWPGHNWYVCRKRTNGLWRFISWDAEYSFQDPSTDPLEYLGGGPGDLFNFLVRDPEFRMAIADRAHKHTSNGGIFTPETAEATWMRRAAQIDRAIVAESARWGDAGSFFPFRQAELQSLSSVRAEEDSHLVTRADWLVEQERLRTVWFPNRARTLLRILRRNELFPLLSAPLLSPSGGRVPVGSTVTITNVDCQPILYYTLDGSDPRLPGGGVSPLARIYTSPVTITNATQIRARGLDAGEWSAIVEATYTVPQDFTKLVVSEIMYHPGGPSGDRGEFLELKNIGSVTLDLSGISFTQGVFYTFPTGTLVAPSQFVVLARDAGWFMAKYPGITPQGVYDGRLNDGFEILTLIEPTGETIFSFAYDDDPPWPTAANGQGYSLVKLSPVGNPADASNWRASTSIGGSPAADDPTPQPPPPTQTAILRPTLSAQRDGSLRIDLPPGSTQWRLLTSETLTGPWRPIGEFLESTPRTVWFTNDALEGIRFFKMMQATPE